MPTLDDAIGQAAVELTDPSTETETEEVTGETTEVGETETEEDKTKREEQETSETRLLYKALKDPNQRGPIIAALAQEIGILTKSDPPETKKEEAKVKKQTLEIFKEALGKDFDFLAVRLSTALDEILADQKEELGTVQQQIQGDRIISETKTAEEILNKETKGDFKKYEPQITKLIDKYQPGAGMSVEEYLRGLYQIASAGSQKVKTTVELSDKIKRNSNDAAGRLRASTHQTTEGKEPIEFRGKGALNKSIEYAIKQITDKK